MTEDEAFWFVFVTAPSTHVMKLTGMSRTAVMNARRAIRTYMSDPSEGVSKGCQEGVKTLSETAALVRAFPLENNLPSLSASQTSLPSVETPQSPKPRQPKKGPVPEGWQPLESTREYIRNLRLDPDHLVEELVLWHQKDTRKNRHENYDVTLKVWARRERKRLDEIAARDQRFAAERAARMRQEPPQAAQAVMDKRASDRLDREMGIW